MQPFFSTDGIHPRNRFRVWRDMVIAQGLPLKLERISDSPFEARIEVADVGPLKLTRYSQNAVRGETTQAMVRSNFDDQNILVILILAGTLSSH